jgi:hypothetical protein
MSVQFDPFEAERKRQQAAAAERLNERGAPATEFSDVRSIAKIALERQGNPLRDSSRRTVHAASEARVADPNDPYSLLRLNRQLAKEPKIDARTPLIRPLFRRFLRDFLFGVIGIAIFSCVLLLVASPSFCTRFCFLLICAYFCSLAFAYFYIKHR